MGVGKRNGSTQRLERIGSLTGQMLEAALNLVAAYPEPVAYGRLHHLSEGSWCPASTSPNTVHDLRVLFGRDSVENVKGVGYRAGRTLLARLRKSMGGE